MSGPDSVRTVDLVGKVALVTGGGAGIGAAVVGRLAGRGASVVVLDIDRDAAEAVAAGLGEPAMAMTVDVTDPAALHGAIESAEGLYGRLDLVHLNAGVVAGQPGVEGLDLAGYRRIVGVNVDHVVVGTCAAVPALRRAGGGTIIATASLAGLIEFPEDPIYTMTKHAVVGYVRAAGAQLAGEGIRLCALCPGFADTALIGPLRARFEAGGNQLLTADEVADAVEAMLAGARGGQAWLVQAGRPAEPYRFRGVPGPRPAEDAPAGSAGSDGQAR